MKEAFEKQEFDRGQEYSNMMNILSEKIKRNRKEINQRKNCDILRNNENLNKFISLKRETVNYKVSSDNIHLEHIFQRSKKVIE